MEDLVNRYLIKRVDRQVNIEQSAGTSEENYESTKNTYKSDELEITIDKKEEGEGKNKITYFVADIKITNPNRIKKAFANNQFGTNVVGEMKDIVNDKKAILAINGDYYSFRNDGVIISNSEIYRNEPAREALAIYEDGKMEIFDEKKVSAEDLIKSGVKNTMSFGPALIKNGEITQQFTTYAVDGDNLIRSNIATKNPRTGVGYYDKNHYCFIVVDGRNEGYSRGVTLDEFAQIFKDLGCNLAYNLDGGNSTNMYFKGIRVNTPSQPGDGERNISDILYIN